MKQLCIVGMVWSLIVGGAGIGQIREDAHREPPHIEVALVISRSEVHPGQEMSYAVSVFVEAEQPVRVITSVTIAPYIEVVEVQTTGLFECGPASAGWITCIHYASKTAPSWLTYHLRVHPAVPDSRLVTVTARASRSDDVESEPDDAAFWIIRAPDDIRAYYIPLFLSGGDVLAHRAEHSQ